MTRDGGCGVDRLGARHALADRFGKERIVGAAEHDSVGASGRCGLEKVPNERSGFGRREVAPFHALHEARSRHVDHVDGDGPVLVRPAEFAADTYTKPELPEEAKETIFTGKRIVPVRKLVIRKNAKE